MHDRPNTEEAREQDELDRAVAAAVEALREVLANERAIEVEFQVLEAA